MKIRLYCDEDSMRHALVAALRKHGLDVSTALESGTTAETDERQLTFATAQGRVLYSHNVGDFCRLHAQWRCHDQSHAGILLAHQEQFSVGERMRRILRLADRLSAEEMQNRLEFLSDWA